MIGITRFSCVYNRYFYAKEMMRYENIIRYIQIHANTEGDHNLALRQSIKERMDGYF